MNRYKELRDKHQAEFNKFPIKFAFSNEQFENGMKELGLTKDDTDKIVATVGGGFMRKSDYAEYEAMAERFAKEHEENLKSLDYVTDMFEFELGNHEYGYTGELEDTLDACDLTIKDIENSEILQQGLAKALEYYKEIE